MGILTSSRWLGLKQAPTESDISMSEVDQRKFFQPRSWFHDSGKDHLYEQVLRTHDRKKRDTSGALHIVTNHAQPIHADVKSDGTGADITEKPCPKTKSKPSHVESGVVFQVTAPEDTFYELKSLRKSWPLPNKLELVRSLSRAITLAVLLVSAVVEFFPVLKSLYTLVYSFIYV